MKYFSYFHQITGRHFMQIIFMGDNLQEMSNPIFWEEYYKIFQKHVKSSENFTQSAKH